MNNKYSISISVLVPALIFTFILGMLVSTGLNISNGLNNGPDSPSISVNSEKIPVDQENFQLFWKAWNMIDERLPNASTTSEQEKIYGAIKGLASAYGDPYTVFFPPLENKLFSENISGNFSGVGMEIGIRDGQLQVVSPIKNSPAERAGVKTGDIILTINGTSTAEMSVDKAVTYIRGPKGTPVTILFLPKDSQKPIERTIIRDIIQIPTLDTFIKPGNIFLIKLYSFSDQSPQLFRLALREFIQTGSNKLILDLRGNPGGYLNASVDIASYFLPAGKTIVIEDFGLNREPVIFRSKKGNYIFNNNLKMLILVDGGSASASEIVAGALQENGVAKLVGTKTFGKGSVQEVLPLNSETSLKITIANWLTPNGHNLSKDGLNPDYEVKFTEKDIQDKKDPQLEKALEIINKM